MALEASAHRQRLLGRRIVLTGAAGGIGTATSARLRSEGAEVAGIDLHPTDDTISGDVTDRADIERAVTHAAEQLGGIDVLVNNAGVGTAQDTGDYPDADARRIMDVNFFGAWNATAAAMPHLLESRGHVVNVVSALALVDVPYVAAYSASKRALDAYSQILRLEYRDRLTVTTIYPGYVRTPIHDRANELGLSVDGLIHEETVEMAAAAIAHACVRRSRWLTLTWRSAGEFLAARAFPRIAARYLEYRWQRHHEGLPSPTFLRFPEDTAATDGGATYVAEDRESVEVAL